MSEDDGSSSSALASKIDLPKSMSLVSYDAADSLGLKNLTGNVLEYDIGLVNEYKQTNIGHWLDTHSQVGDKELFAVVLRRKILLLPVRMASICLKTSKIQF
ncbi:hypothetical protein KR100_15305 [Synechococcus sp. KORDI-100]|uniref:hypothetical protein n=1 Tax=Synechococcus sp. KORDI-100 TaxID=1280380 RepID=UPI0004E0623E|nr:hypothetical protein [Synechococcus sp. KORDI-100]AII44711.1 hypothetical protein KR100_15305 [Synechococcus sp. KORDI-100]